MANRFDSEEIPGETRQDMGIMASATIFAQHCKGPRKPFAYLKRQKLEKRRQDFLMGEIVDYVFISNNLVCWLNHISHPYQLVETVTTPTEDERPNIFAPLHLWNS